jgi:hypothetical protein
MLEFLAKSLLEASHVDIEAQNFSREWMLGGESFGTPDALLPGICSHPGDYRASSRGRQLRRSGLSRLWNACPAAQLTVNEPRDYISGKF